MPNLDENTLREQIVRTMRAMATHGLNRGTSGNVSARCGTGMLITPSGVVPEELTPESIVLLDAEGNARPGSLKPSSEWQMHHGILAGRPDVNAVVHCHSRYATILACAGKFVPAVHYMVGVSGGPYIPVAPYASFGSPELAAAVVEALDGRNACLMANHGQIAVAPSLAFALAVAEEVEEQSAVYWGTLAIGGPVLLGDEQMADIMLRFRSYGQSK